MADLKTNNSLNENDYFLNKEMLESVCDCGETGYVFIGDFTRCYYTFCRRCNKKIYHLSCKKCESGFAYPSSRLKLLNPTKGWWQCEICKFMNSFNPQECEFVKSFNYSEIPKEIKERYKLNPNPWVWVLIIIIVVSARYLPWVWGLLIIFGLVLYLLRFMKKLRNILH